MELGVFLRLFGILSFGIWEGKLINCEELMGNVNSGDEMYTLK